MSFAVRAGARRGAVGPTAELQLLDLAELRHRARRSAAAGRPAQSRRGHSPASLQSDLVSKERRDALNLAEPDESVPDTRGTVFKTGQRPQAGECDTPAMFELIVTVKRGSASSLLPTWSRYPDVASARLAASALLREERVQRILIVRRGIAPGFCEWLER